MSKKDNRRNTGPENTVPLAILRGRTTNLPFLNNDGFRNDGRSALNIREFYLGMSNISQAKGSSYAEVGNTKVICGVYGPRESPPTNTFRASGIVYCEIKFAPFSQTIRKSLIPDSQVKELGTQVKEAFEAVIILAQYPKSQIDIYISVIEDAGSVLAACINATTLALTNAGIQMYDLLVSTSMVWYDGTIHLDPTSSEEKHILDKAKAAQNSNGQLTVALMPAYAKGQIALMVQSGAVVPEDFQKGFEAALDACKKIYTIVKQVILNNLDESKLQDSKE